MYSPSRNVNQSSNVPTTSLIADKEKRDQKSIIQSFYSKTAQIVVQGRLTTSDIKRPSIREYNSSSKKPNNWFNIATEDIALLREDLKYWRSLAAADNYQEQVPPMTIDIYLDTSRLTPNQTLLAADDNLRWGFVDVLHMNRILIETWVLTLKLLPAYELYRRMRKSNESSPLSIGYRLSSNPNMQYNSEIPLNSTILENDARKPTNHYKFSDIVTPNGTFNLSVTYRRNCAFKVEDRERDLSAQFIDMDEQFFTPTMTKYQHTKSRPTSQSSVTRKKSSSSISSRNSLEMNQKLNISISSSSRHGSITRTVSPFKSPSLSSSPQIDSGFPSTMTSRQSTTLDASRRGFDSGSFGRKIEFSSSFEKYKSSTTGKIPDSPSLSSIRRLSTENDLVLNKDDDGLEDFFRLVMPKQELRSFQRTPNFTPLSTDTSTGSDMTSSVGGSLATSKKSALSHFQSLRDTHTSLSESLSSSLMIATTPSSHNEVTGTSPVSSISSASKSFQPVIPSPLHAEQNSILTVHIPPPSDPRIGPMIQRDDTSLRNRQVDDSSYSRKDDSSQNQSLAYPTYPQDNPSLRASHNLAVLKDAADNLNNDSTPDNVAKKGTHILDDDDSLVFNLIELGCESSAQPQDEQQEMIYNRSLHRLKSRSLEQSFESSSPQQSASEEDQDQRNSNSLIHYNTW
ncbi:hypothetical protein G6F46_005360 [Rhizopus delemar]|uniref:Autophagy-related protein 13 n=2 Tax=Rhizopus TaxID=4842 RepID=A0A9P6Z551_9FUNG|nr:hypothetical protein G6F55_001954 [Rhizopus delemar]KAG1548972.1 hypothetical protein G6F51_003335 [Rhizopus arrhizus]KAG1502100.1 hypothetical protein G6F54_002587 [Rhizopus delemar]KAG1512770.1 hypothetical protein G6F53_004932 [Rhizopus delemar]KAG1527292.1 hypothetical protein G6F52_001664 [Rhizopus delemar]